MPTTQRPGLPDSGEVIVTAGNGTTPQTVLDTRDDANYEINEIVIEYDPAATATTELTLHDDPDGTAGGDLDAALKTIKNLTPGEVRSYDDLSMRDFEQDVIVQADGNQDDEVAVYVDGKNVTGSRARSVM